MHATVVFGTSSYMSVYSFYIDTLGHHTVLQLALLLFHSRPSVAHVHIGIAIAKRTGTLTRSAGLV